MKKTKKTYITHTLHTSDEFIQILAKAIQLTIIAQRKPISVHIMIGDYLAENPDFPLEIDEIDTLSFIRMKELRGSNKLTIRLPDHLNSSLHERRIRYEKICDTQLTVLETFAFVFNEIVMKLHALEDS